MMILIEKKKTFSYVYILFSDIVLSLFKKKTQLYIVVNNCFQKTVLNKLKNQMLNWPIY